MSEMRYQLVDLAESLFSAAPGDLEAGWARIAAAGFDQLLVPEERGGFGGDWGDVFAVLRVAGERALPLPLGEAITARFIADRARIAVAGERLALADRVSGVRNGDCFAGVLARVPCGRRLEEVVAVLDGEILVLRVPDAVLETGTNLAGEERDTLRFEGAPVRYATTGRDSARLGAFVRVAQSAGVLDAGLALAVEHTNSRIQFGKPLSKQQSVQQSLAIAASEAAAVNVAAQAAALALNAGDATFELAAAKLRTNMAIAVCTRFLHQVHGAIGFTEEYQLQSLTRRLMSWRSEFGGDCDLAAFLGGRVAELGATGFWPELTRRSDRAAKSAAVARPGEA